MWSFASLAGAAIMYSAVFLFRETDDMHVRPITFTALIFTELITLALTVHTWHWTMVAAHILSAVIYLSTLFAVGGWFGKCDWLRSCYKSDHLLKAHSRIHWNSCGRRS